MKLLEFYLWLVSLTSREILFHHPSRIPAHAVIVIQKKDRMMYRSTPMFWKQLGQVTKFVNVSDKRMGRYLVEHGTRLNPNLGTVAIRQRCDRYFTIQGYNIPLPFCTVATTISEPTQNVEKAMAYI